MRKKEGAISTNFLLNIYIIFSFVASLIVIKGVFNQQGGAMTPVGPHIAPPVALDMEVLSPYSIYSRLSISIYTFPTFWYK